MSIMAPHPASAALSAPSGASETATPGKESILKEYYNISNFENALEMLQGSNEVSVFSIGNVSLYIKSIYQSSQSTESETFSAALSNAVSTSGVRLVSGSTNLSDIYGLLGTDKLVTESFLENIVGFFDNNEYFVGSICDTVINRAPNLLG